MFDRLLESLGRWPTYSLGAPEHAWLAYGLALGLLWGAARWAWGRSLPLPGGQGAGWLRWAAPLPRLLRYAGLALLLLALLRPQTLRNSANASVQTLDIFLALDVSGSMQAPDLEPTRLEAAKATLKEFVNGLPGDRVGLVVFAGKAFTQCPLTLDHSVVVHFIEQMQQGTVNLNGTAVGDGLLLGVSRLVQEQAAKDKVIILATDGISNTGVDVLKAAQQAADFGVKVYTVGIGRKGGAVVRGDFGQLFRMEEPDEGVLTKVAQLTGGRYYRATDAGSLKQVYREIASLERREVKVKRRQDADEHFYLFLLAGALLLLAEAVLRLRFRVTA